MKRRGIERKTEEGGESVFRGLSNRSLVARKLLQAIPAVGRDGGKMVRARYSRSPAASRAQNWRTVLPSAIFGGSTGAVPFSSIHAAARFDDSSVPALS